MDGETTDDGWRGLPCGHRVRDPRQPHYCDLLGLDVALQDEHDWAAKALSLVAGGAPEATLGIVYFLGQHRVIEEAFHLAVRLARQAITLAKTGQGHLAATAIHMAAAQVGVATTAFGALEQLPVASFLAFREALSPASGAESEAFRLLEVYGGARLDSPRPGRSGDATTYAEYLSAPHARTRLLTRRVVEAATQYSLRDVAESADPRRPDEKAALEGAVRAYLSALDALRARHLEVVHKFIGGAVGTGKMADAVRLESVRAMAEGAKPEGCAHAPGLAGQAG
jgi:hypothetical protein